MKLFVVMSVCFLSAMLAFCDPGPKYSSSSVAQLNNSMAETEGRNLPLLLLTPLAGLAALTLGGVFKLGLVLSILANLVTLFPGILDLVKSYGVQIPDGFSLPPSQRAFEGYGTWNPASITDLTDQSFKYLKLDAPECRYRAVCEVSNFMATRIPYFDQLMRSIARSFTSFNTGNPYSRAWIEGLSKSGCGLAYEVSCPKSPFARLPFYRS